MPITGKQKEKYFSDIHSTLYLRQHALSKIANTVKETTPINHKILIVWQNTSGVERVALIYNLVPWTAYLSAPFSFGKRGNGDIWTVNLSRNKFKALLGRADYLLLAYTDKNFWDHYGSLFHDNPHMLKPLTTYTLCLAPGFNGVNQPGCTLKQEQAYLFRIVKHNSDIKLKNIAGDTE
ncbi:MAG: hypothetical protein GY821_07580 [Gammaproteobacteria bacterium]|nr:hypothetical protein [Gammaproteobacteria bacterium]